MNNKSLCNVFFEGSDFDIRILSIYLSIIYHPTVLRPLSILPFAPRLVAKRLYQAAALLFGTRDGRRLLRRQSQLHLLVVVLLVVVILCEARPGAIRRGGIFWFQFVEAAREVLPT